MLHTALKKKTAATITSERNPPARAAVKQQGDTLRAVFGSDFVMELEGVPDDMTDLLKQV